MYFHVFYITCNMYWDDIYFCIAVTCCSTSCMQIEILRCLHSLQSHSAGNDINSGLLRSHTQVGENYVFTHTVWWVCAFTGTFLHMCEKSAQAFQGIQSSILNMPEM